MLTLSRCERREPISDLAAGLTDRTLELLSRAGVRGDSVAIELETWRALADAIERGFERIQTRPAYRRAFHLGALAEAAVRSAAARVARQFGRSGSAAPAATPTLVLTGGAA